MAETDCIFCKIIEGQIPCHKVCEDDAVLAFLDIGPVSEGHTLIIPKTHYERFDQCPQDVVNSMMAAVQKLAKAIPAAMDAPAYNLLCNNGPESGQKVFHVHFHVIPRKPNDGILKGWPAQEYPDGRPQQVLEMIQAQL